MRKITIAALALAFSSSMAFAQSSGTLQTKEQLTVNNVDDVAKRGVKSKSSNGAEAIIWQETFGSGIPSTWTNQGFNGFGNVQANCLWEYRGPNTTPNNTVASRGAYWSGGAITSPTVANGFVVFDSDYLDNGGVAGNFGNGSAPGPNIAVLTTNTINLTNEPFVQLSMYSLFRTLGSNATFQKSKVAFSTDGGLTWPDTILLHPTLGSNTVFQGVEVANVSAYIGGESNVKMRIMFDARQAIALTGGLTAYGYYFWAFDDIKLESLPKHELRFTEWNGAPAQDIIYGPQAGSSKMGIMSKNSASDQTRDIEFDANVLNYGWGSLNNVKLTVDILDLSGTLLTSFTSTGSANLSPGDTADYNTLNTYNNPWNPNAVGVYQVVYKATSDSATAVSDTFYVQVSDSLMSLDNNVFSNSLGTPNLGNDGSALASRIDLIQPALMTGVWVGLSSTTVAGATLEVVIADSTGFDYTVAGFPTASLRGQSDPNSPYVITAADITNGYVQIPVNDGTNPYVSLPAGGYFVAVYMYSNNGANLVRIINDATFSQSGGSKIMFDSDDNRWYSGYSASRTFNNPWIRAKFWSAIGIEENILSTSVKVGPNPASDVLNVSFDNIEGDFTLTMTDVTGRVVRAENISVFGAANHTMSVNGLAKGVYMLNINNGKANITHKISVQ